MFYPSHTILLITRQVLARIDLSGKRRLVVKQIWSEPSCEYEAIVPEVTRALKLGNRRPGRITIVSPDFWTDVLSVPADIAAIASENEIHQALALEAEVDSGLSAFDSRTSVLRIDNEGGRSDDCQWCVTQLPNGQLHEFSRALRSSGARLYSLAHPIAAMLSVQPVSIETVQKVLDDWRDPVTLSTDELQTFALEWAACLRKNPAHPLLILGETESTNNSQPIALTASLALLTAGGCGLWHWQSQQSLALTTHAIERLEKQQSEHEAMQESLKSAEASVVQLRQEVAKAQSIRQATERQLKLAGATHSQHNGRWLALVDALAGAASEDCWVQRIESSSVQTIVHGLALDNAAANGFAGRLEIALDESGWRTSPAATSLSPHNLIAFKIVLKAKSKPSEPVAGPQISLKSYEHSSIAVSNVLSRGTKP